MGWDRTGEGRVESPPSRGRRSSPRRWRWDMETLQDEARFRRGLRPSSQHVDSDDDHHMCCRQQHMQMHVVVVVVDDRPPSLPEAFHAATHAYRPRPAYLSSDPPDMHKAFDTSHLNGDGTQHY